MKVKTSINILNLIGAICALLVTLSIFNGTAQEVVYFIDPLNEMAMAFMSTLLTIGLTAISFERTK